MTATILTNARVYTMDPGQPRASGLIIQDGLITHLLSEAPTPQKNYKVIDFNNQVILPGLIDSHLHLRKYAVSLEKVDCETTSREECLERVRTRVGETPPREWIQGHGWNHNTWPEGYGSASELDLIAPDHPVYLTGKSLHVSWANTLALQMAGIDENTPDPPRGIIQRDENGEPTGILLEDAVKLIEDVIPLPSVEKTGASILKAQEKLWQLGLTGVHDFDKELCIAALQYLEDTEELGLRVNKSLPSNYLPEAIERGYQTGKGSDWLWFGGVKDFADGALGPQTAAMLSPFQGTDQSGMLLMSEDELLELGLLAANGGIALSIHAIGDLANRSVINVIQRLRDHEKKSGITPLPHRIEHVQIIDPSDIPRMAELDITASMQPIHATSDMEMADKYLGERAAYAYAPRLQFDQGTRVVFGSDAPVESPNPWLSIHAAVTRRRIDGSPGPNGWHPTGRLTIAETLKAFTINPAQATGTGKVQGKLLPGYWADLIVLEADPFQSDPNELHKTLPIGTMIDGKWVYKDF